MLNAMRRNKQRRQIAERLHAATVAQARRPDFFERFAVKDTLDGRFDLVVLHAWLVLERLKTEPALSQVFVDTVFTGFDEGLRELGAGDIGMGKRMKKLADAFYGRLQAYGGAGDAEAMEAALIRNLYRGAPEAAARLLARYVMDAKAALAAQSVENGALDFGGLPQEADSSDA